MICSGGIGAGSDGVGKGAASISGMNTIGGAGGMMEDRGGEGINIGIMEVVEM